MSESPPRQPLRILVVDDHILFRRGICQVMADISDMEVVAEAADGEQAVREVERLRPHGLDLVLMDVEMPKLDGMAATRRIAAVDPDLPVVMLTVSGLDQDVLAAIQAGAVGFLSKSLSAPALIRTLRDFHRERALPMSRTMATRVLTQLRSPAAESARGASTTQ
ncbi:MAG: response regulator transcription factor, partial [Chloroflexota bacterium]|nr:response regulator transcription factor [Chloroflexota bacterium]